MILSRRQEEPQWVLSAEAPLHKPLLAPVPASWGQTRSRYANRANPATRTPGSTSRLHLDLNELPPCSDQLGGPHKYRGSPSAGRSEGGGGGGRGSCQEAAPESSLQRNTPGSALIGFSLQQPDAQHHPAQTLQAANSVHSPEVQNKQQMVRPPLHRLDSASSGRQLKRPRSAPADRAGLPAPPHRQSQKPAAVQDRMKVAEQQLLLWQQQMGISDGLPSRPATSTGLNAKRPSPKLTYCGMAAPPKGQLPASAAPDVSGAAGLLLLSRHAAELIAAANGMQSPAPTGTAISATQLHPGCSLEHNPPFNRCGSNAAGPLPDSAKLQELLERCIAGTHSTSSPTGSTRQKYSTRPAPEGSSTAAIHQAIKRSWRAEHSGAVAKAGGNMPEVEDVTQRAARPQKYMRHPRKPKVQMVGSEGNAEGLTLRYTNTGVETEEPAYVVFNLPPKEWPDDASDDASPTAVTCRFLFQKRLSGSDTGPMGRIILPRLAAEDHFPWVHAPAGIDLPCWDTLQGSVWHFKLKFWMNGLPHPKRMYVMEQTRGYGRAVGLREGLTLAFYKASDGRWVVDANPIEKYFCQVQ